MMSNKLLNDLRDYGEFMGIYVGKRLVFVLARTRATLELTMTLMTTIEMIAAENKANRNNA